MLEVAHSVLDEIFELNYGIGQDSDIIILVYDPSGDIPHEESEVYDKFLIETFCGYANNCGIETHLVKARCNKNISDQFEIGYEKVDEFIEFEIEYLEIDTKSLVFPSFDALMQAEFSIF